MNDEVVITSEITREKIANAEVPAVAQRFIDLIAEGAEPEEALETAGVSKTALAATPLLRQTLEKLKAVGHLTAEVQREILRTTRSAAHLELFNRGITLLREEGDERLLEAALKWDKAIAEDPKVGLKAPPVTQINVDVAPLERLVKEQPPAAVVFGWDDGAESPDKDGRNDRA